MDFPEETVAELSLAHIRWELQQKADAMHIDVKELSSTLCSALYDRKTRKLLLVNLGDGMIITGSKSGCAVPAMPSDSRNGCYVTTTPEAEKKMRVYKMDAGTAETIYLCSDGAWHNLFERSRMRQEVQTMIKMKRNKQLGDYLQKQDPFDDCTFITMELKKKSERNYA
jgi:serine/threonine protein phosphatase PrpC